MQYHHRDGSNPSHPAGDSKKLPLRVDFDRRLKLEFLGSKITSDSGLLAYRELDDVLGLTDLAGAALSDLRRGKNTPRPLHHFPDGGGRHLKSTVRRHPTADRRPAAKTSVDVNRGVTECLSKFEGEVCLNHANEGGFQLVGGNRMAFVSGMAVKGVRLLPPIRHVGTMDVGMRAKMGNLGLGYC